MSSDSTPSTSSIRLRRSDAVSAALDEKTQSQITTNTMTTTKFVFESKEVLWRDGCFVHEFMRLELGRRGRSILHSFTQTEGDGECYVRHSGTAIDVHDGYALVVSKVETLPNSTEDSQWVTQYQRALKALGMSNLKESLLLLERQVQYCLALSSDELMEIQTCSPLDECYEFKICDLSPTQMLCIPEDHPWSNRIITKLRRVI